MSIITETLHRLQSAYGRTGLSPEGPVPETVSPTFFQDPSKPNAFSRMRVAVGVIGATVLLVGLGIGGYLWGLSLIPESSAPRADHSVRLAAGESSSESAIENSLEKSQTLVATDESNPLLSQADVGPDAIEDVEVPLGEKSSLSPMPDSDDMAGEARPPSSGTVRAGESLPSPKPLAGSIDERVPGEGVPEVQELEGPTLVVPVGSQQAAPRSTTSNGRSHRHSPVADNPPVARAEPVSLGNPPQALSKAESLIAAQRLIREGKYQEALPLLQAVKGKASREWEFWMLLGTVRLGLGKFELADQALLEGLARDGMVAPLWIQRAIVAQQRGRFDESVSFLRQAEILAPELPEVFLNLAYTFERQGLVDSASRYYRKFLASTEGQRGYVGVRKKILARLIHVSSSP